MAANPVAQFRRIEKCLEQCLCQTPLRLAQSIVFFTACASVQCAHAPSMNARFHADLENDRLWWRLYIGGKNKGPAFLQPGPEGRANRNHPVVSFIESYEN